MFTGEENENYPGQSTVVTSAKLDCKEILLRQETQSNYVTVYAGGSNPENYKILQHDIVMTSDRTAKDYIPTSHGVNLHVIGCLNGLSTDNKYNVYIGGSRGLVLYELMQNLTFCGVVQGKTISPKRIPPKSTETTAIVVRGRFPVYIGGNNPWPIEAGDQLYIVLPEKSLVDNRMNIRFRSDVSPGRILPLIYPDRLRFQSYDYKKHLLPNQTPSIMFTPDLISEVFTEMDLARGRLTVSNVVDSIKLNGLKNLSVMVRDYTIFMALRFFEAVFRNPELMLGRQVPDWNAFETNIDNRIAEIYNNYGFSGHGIRANINTSHANEELRRRTIKILTNDDTDYVADPGGLDVRVYPDLFSPPSQHVGQNPAAGRSYDAIHAITDLIMAFKHAEEERKKFWIGTAAESSANKQTIDVDIRS